MALKHAQDLLSQAKLSGTHKYVHLNVTLIRIELKLLMRD